MDEFDFDEDDDDFYPPDLDVIEKRTERMIGDVGYWIGFLVSVGVIVFSLVRYFDRPDFIDQIFSNPEGYVLMIGVPWILGWGF